MCIRDRCRQMGGRRAAARLTIGTFHAICRSLLGDVRLIFQLSSFRASAASSSASPRLTSRTSPRRLRHMA